MQDKNGKQAFVGDIVRVIQLPEVDFDPAEYKEVITMLDALFPIEAIENNAVQVSKWLDAGKTEHCHTLFLWSDEFEVVAHNVKSK